jgi:hypothetical protein
MPGRFFPDHSALFGRKGEMCDSGGQYSTNVPQCHGFGDDADDFRGSTGLHLVKRSFSGGGTRNEYDKILPNPCDRPTFVAPAA